MQGSGAGFCHREFRKATWDGTLPIPLPCLLLRLTALGFGAGTLFWKWALSPKNPREDYLEVAVPDPTFTDIVVPGAKAALDWAKKASPATNCEKVAYYPCPVLLQPVPRERQRRTICQTCSLNGPLAVIHCACG